MGPNSFCEAQIFVGNVVMSTHFMHQYACPGECSRCVIIDKVSSGRQKQNTWESKAAVCELGEAMLLVVAP